MPFFIQLPQHSVLPQFSERRQTSLSPDQKSHRSLSTRCLLETMLVPISEESRTAHRGYQTCYPRAIESHHTASNLLPWQIQSPPSESQTACCPPQSLPSAAC